MVEGIQALHPLEHINIVQYDTAALGHMATLFVLLGPKMRAAASNDGPLKRCSASPTTTSTTEGGFGDGGQEVGTSTTTRRKVSLVDGVGWLVGRNNIHVDVHVCGCVRACVRRKVEMT
jgi:hypothetical protein